MAMKNKAEIIRQYHDGAIGCAEAMILGVREILNQEVDPILFQNTLVLSDVFRKGIAGLQETCGYVSGFAMGLSLYIGSDSEEYQAKVKEFAEYQKTLYDSNQCFSIVNEFDEFVSPERKDYCTKMLEALLAKSEDILKDI